MVNMDNDGILILRMTWIVTYNNIFRNYLFVYIMTSYLTTLIPKIKSLTSKYINQMKHSDT